MSGGEWVGTKIMGVQIFAIKFVKIFWIEVYRLLKCWYYFISKWVCMKTMGVQFCKEMRQDILVFSELVVEVLVLFDQSESWSMFLNHG